MTQFSVAFGELQRIDDEVLALAVKNTNVKAYGLLFGPATQTLAEMDAALARVVARYADSTDGKRVMEMAFGARIGVLRIQTLLAPHIAEENDAKMDQMEASMVKEETQIRKDLDGLAALTRLAGDPTWRRRRHASLTTKRSKRRSCRSRGRTPTSGRWPCR